MSDLDTARQQAESDKVRGLGPAATHTWDAAVKEAYDATYNKPK